MIEINHDEEPSATLTRLMRELADARRAAHANAQRVTELEAELVYPTVMARAAHELCEVVVKHGWAHAQSERRGLLAAHRATTPSPNQTHVVVSIEELEQLRGIEKRLSASIAEGYNAEFTTDDLHYILDGGAR